MKDKQRLKTSRLLDFLLLKLHILDLNWAKNLFTLFFLWTFFTVLQSLQKLNLFFQLFLSFFFLLPLQTFFMSSFFYSFNFFFSTLRKLIPHLIFFFSLCSFKFKIALIVSLTPISVISEPSSGHGRGNILNFFDSDGSESIVCEFHAFMLFDSLIKQILL